METNFDCIVIGAGPAGLSAALNLRQRGKTVLVVHSGETLLAKAEQVDNYLGMPGLSGKQMMERFTQHARDAGAVLRKGRAGNVMPFGGRFMVNLDGDILETGAVVLACGVSKARPVPGEAELLGRGVSYCATCDGMLYRGKTVVVVGGGNSAAEDALFLSRVCKKVYLVHRGAVLTASKSYWTALWPPNMQKPIWPNRRTEENQNRRGHKKRPRLFWFWRKTYWPNRPARPPETPSPQLFTASEALCRASTAPFNLATASLNACTSIWLILPSSVLMARFTASISSFETCSATAARSTPSSAAEMRPMLFIVLPRHTTTAASSTASSAAAARIQSSWPRSSSLVRRVSSRISFCSMVRLLSYAFAVMIARNRAAVHRFCAKQGRLSALWKTAGCATMKQQTGGMIP